MIQPIGSRFIVKSEKTGKPPLSKPVSKAEAGKRLAQIEYFKVRDAGKKRK